MTIEQARDLYERAVRELQQELCDRAQPGDISAKVTVQVLDMHLHQFRLKPGNELGALLVALKLDAALFRDDDGPFGDWTDLPTFGGDEPTDTHEVWSWDADNLLVGTCADDLEIKPRVEWGV